MSLDNFVNEAVKIVVNEEGQPESLANKIIAWITALSSGNENIDDADNALTRARLLYEDTALTKDSEAE